MDYILFDLDGTLTDSQAGIFGGLAYALEHGNKPIPEIDTLRKFIGPPLREGLSTFGGFAEEEIETAMDRYRDYYKEKGYIENEPYEGVEKLLSDLKKAGKKLIVATSKPEIMAKKILDHFQLSQYFQDVCGATYDEIRSAKQDVIQYALDQNKITDYSKVIMIGDRKHDIMGAKGVGIASIGILYGFGDREELEQAGADAVVAEVSELYDVIMNW